MNVIRFVKEQFNIPGNGANVLAYVMNHAEKIIAKKLAWWKW
tara:strand:+ start:438 stop:563 length:126 start_codon:yes stop_codon:yes gene_type:complete